MSGGFCDRLQETNIKKLVIVECHGVTKTTRTNPHNTENIVEVVYPTLLTAHLGTETTVCGDLFQQARRICEIVTGHIKYEYEHKGFKNGISVGELVQVLESDVVDNGDGGYALLAKNTPIKRKLPGEKFQNIELFCPGVRLESGPGNYPFGNVDGVWVCDLIGADEENPFGVKKTTEKLFTNMLKYDQSGKVVKDMVQYDPKLKKYSIPFYSWLTHEGGIVTYRELTESLKENSTDFPPETTAIQLATCRGFEDDPYDVKGDAVPSNPLDHEMQLLRQRQKEIARRRDQIMQQQQQQQPPDVWETDIIDDSIGSKRKAEDDWETDIIDSSKRKAVQSEDDPWDLDGGSKRNAKKRGRGGSNKKRRYTKRKKYFKSTRKVNKLKIKKKRTRKYKNKK